MKKTYQELSNFSIDIGKINVLAKTDIIALEAYLDHLESIFPEKRAICIHSQKISPKGYPIFCAGADQRERADWSYEAILSHVAYQRAVLHRLRQSSLWVIACVDGLALGLGVEMCLAADFVVASDKAIFAFPEKDWGIIPGAGGTAWANGWAKHRDVAQSMIQSGEKIDAQKAQWLGIVDICAESSDFECHLEAIMSWIKGMDSASQSEMKQRYWEKIDFKKWFTLEHEAYAQALRLKFQQR